MFTINSSLCEVEYSIDLETIDVDVMEYIFFKIRENRENPSDTITIGYSEIKKRIGRYQKNDYIQSLKRLDGITITTNQKSQHPSDKYKFNFIIEKKNFKVGMDDKIFILFHQPKSYNMYHQHYVYGFKEKYSKLFYKFIIRYRKLVGKSIYVNSDVLMKILNIHTDKPFYKIQSDIFKSSVKKINKDTNLNILFEKDSIEYKNETEIVKYKVTIKSYKKEEGEDEVKGKDLKSNKVSKLKSEYEARLDEWIKDLKDGVEDYDKNSNKIPMIGIYNPISHLPIYIDDDYRLTNLWDYYSNNSSKTMDTINRWIKNEEFDYGVEMVDQYPNKLGKLCLLPQSEIKKRGFI